MLVKHFGCDISWHAMHLWVLIMSMIENGRAVNLAWSIICRDQKGRECNCSH